MLLNLCPLGSEAAQVELLWVSEGCEEKQTNEAGKFCLNRKGQIWVAFNNSQFMDIHFSIEFLFDSKSHQYWHHPSQPHLYQKKKKKSFSDSLKLGGYLLHNNACTIYLALLKNWIPPCNYLKIICLPMFKLCHVASSWAVYHSWMTR